jgi:hypothetical protein
MPAQASRERGKPAPCRCERGGFDSGRLASAGSRAYPTAAGDQAVPAKLAERVERVTPRRRPYSMSPGRVAA